MELKRYLSEFHSWAPRRSRYLHIRTTVSLQNNGSCFFVWESEAKLLKVLPLKPERKLQNEFTPSVISVTAQDLQVFILANLLRSKCQQFQFWGFILWIMSGKMWPLCNISIVLETANTIAGSL